MRRHYCSWSNDNTWDPHICRMMQLGANRFIPANYMGLAIGPERDGRGSGLDADFSDLSFLSRMAGEFFLQGGIAGWPEEVKRRAKHWISVFKTIRHLLVKDYYRLLPQPQSEQDWDAGQFCDGTHEGVVFVFRCDGRLTRQSLPLRSLDPDKQYRFRDEASGAEEVFPGAELLTGGLRVELQPNSARLYYYRYG